MTLHALLLGDPGRLAFAGHLRLSQGVGGAHVAVAARVGVGGERSDPDTLVAAYRAASALQQALRTGLSDVAPGPDGGVDRHLLLRTVWEALLTAPSAAHGPLHGAETTLLAIASDADGIGVSGVGLCGVWALRTGGPSSLAEPGHPLLAPPGLPTRVPGVLTLDDPAEVDGVLGAPSHLAALHGGDGLGVETAGARELARRCGVRS